MTFLDLLSFLVAEGRWQIYTKLFNVAHTNQAARGPYSHVDITGCQRGLRVGVNVGGAGTFDEGVDNAPLLQRPQPQAPYGGEVLLVSRCELQAVFQRGGSDQCIGQPKSEFSRHSTG
jgi:hypothetical protein